MAIVNEIPLTPDNQKFSIALKDLTYQVRILWREDNWSLDLMSGEGGDIISGIPMVMGYDLLKQYAYLKLGFSLYVVCDDPAQEGPTINDLGIYSHLLVVTE